MPIVRAQRAPSLDITSVQWLVWRHHRLQLRYGPFMTQLLLHAVLPPPLVQPLSTYARVRDLVASYSGDPTLPQSSVAQISSSAAAEQRRPVARLDGRHWSFLHIRFFHMYQSGASKLIILYISLDSISLNSDDVRSLSHSSMALKTKRNQQNRNRVFKDFTFSANEKTPKNIRPQMAKQLGDKYPPLTPVRSTL